MENLTEQEIVRRGKLEKYTDLGIDPFGQRYDVKYHSTDVKNIANKEVEEFKNNHKDLNDEELKEQLHQYIENKNSVGAFTNKGICPCVLLFVKSNVFTKRVA